MSKTGNAGKSSDFSMPKHVQSGIFHLVDVTDQTCSEAKRNDSTLKMISDLVSREALLFEMFSTLKQKVTYLTTV